MNRWAPQELVIDDAITPQADKGVNNGHCRTILDAALSMPRGQAVTLDEVLAFRRERFEASLALVAKKGHDYNREQQQGGDTLFNLRVCELLGITDTAEQGILTRLSDKFMRLISLTAPGVEPANGDEPVLATVDDVHNYVDYLALLYRKRRAARKPCVHHGGPSAPCEPQR